MDWRKGTYRSTNQDASILACYRLKQYKSPHVTILLQATSHHCFDGTISHHLVGWRPWKTVVSATCWRMHVKGNTNTILSLDAVASNNMNRIQRFTWFCDGQMWLWHDYILHHFSSSFLLFLNVSPELSSPPPSSSRSSSAPISPSTVLILLSQWTTLHPLHQLHIKRYCESPRNLQICSAFTSSIFCLMPHSSFHWTFFPIFLPRNYLSSYSTTFISVISNSSTGHSSQSSCHPTPSVPIHFSCHLHQIHRGFAPFTNSTSTFASHVSTLLHGWDPWDAMACLLIEVVLENVHVFVAYPVVK